jgi:NAD dependent epimerase/dehydratase family enzyme
VLRRPAILPAPAFALRLAFGEMADDVLVASQRVQPEALQRAGYSFQFTDLRQALINLLR